MTFPCKEQLYYFEGLARQQKQIYNDSADFGLPMSDFDVDFCRDELKEMMNFYRDSRFNYKAGSWTNGKSVRFDIPVEWDEGQLFGITFFLSFHADKTVSGGGFITIIISYNKVLK